MHNCKKFHPKKSHRRRNRFLRRTLEPIRFPANWGSSETGPAPEERAVCIDRSRSMLTAPAHHPASMLRRLSAMVKRLFVRKAPGR